MQENASVLICLIYYLAFRHLCQSTRMQQGLQRLAGWEQRPKNKEQNVNAQLVWFITFDPGYEIWIHKEIDKRTKEKKFYK